MRPSISSVGPVWGNSNSLSHLIPADVHTCQYPSDTPQLSRCSGHVFPSASLRKYRYQSNHLYGNLISTLHELGCGAYTTPQPAGALGCFSASFSYRCKSAVNVWAAHGGWEMRMSSYWPSDNAGWGTTPWRESDVKWIKHWKIEKHE